MFCPNCGTNNDAGTLFCENCGARLAQEQPVYQQPQQPAQTVCQQPSYPAPAPKKSKLPLIIGIIVAIAIAVGCYFAFSGDDKDGSVSAAKVNKSPENAALTFVEGLLENDSDKALTAVYPEMDGIEREIENQCEELHADAEENDITFDDAYVTDVEDDAEEIDVAEEYLLESYDTEATVDELKVVEICIERSSGADRDSMNVDVYVAKIDGKWYVIRTN